MSVSDFLFFCTLCALSAIQFHNIWDKADISTAHISKIWQLPPIQSRWINSSMAPGRMKVRRRIFISDFEVSTVSYLCGSSLKKGKSSPEQSGWNNRTTGEKNLWVNCLFKKEWRRSCCMFFHILFNLLWITVINLNYLQTNHPFIKPQALICFLAFFFFKRSRTWIFQQTIPHAVVPLS